MTRAKMLPCCKCGADAVPNDGRMPVRHGRVGWYPGKKTRCPKCGAQLRVAVTEDYSDDAIAYTVEIG